MLLRKLIAFSDAGADQFFGEPEFETLDLLRTTQDSRGVVSIMELPGVVAQPALFSSFLMWLLADLFQDLPEVGDVDKPKLVFFFDEAHLLFKDASKEFISSITQTVRLIRSKGVGVFFVTQTPKDVHPDVLAQLGNRVQHALRAYTPGRREGAEGDGVDVPEVVVRPRRGADPTRHRRGDRDDAQRDRRADAGRLDPALRAAVADGRGRHRPMLTGIVTNSALYREVREPRSTANPRTRCSPPGMPNRGTRRRRHADDRRRAESGDQKEPKPEPSLAEKILGSPVAKSMLRAGATAAAGAIVRSIFSTSRKR